MNENKDLLELIWRLLVAVFILLVVGVVMLIGYVIEADMICVVVFYVAIFAVPIAIVKGLFAIIDYHRSQEEQEE